MKKVRLGRTGLMVSELGFGGIPIQRLTIEGAVAVVRRCLDAGINYIDTAHGYTTSEERIGLAIKDRREGLVIATKAPATDPAQFTAQMELSFQRLQVDHIDLLQFHGVSTPAKYEGVLASGGPLDLAREAQAAGRVGHIGITSHSLDMAIQFAKDNLFETIMFPFNFITQEPLNELIPLCRQNDIGFIAMKPVGGGMLWDIEVAFKWLRQASGVVPLVGMQSFEEIAQNVAAMNGPAELTPEELTLMETRRAGLGTRFCRACDYCQPCPQGIGISRILRTASFFRRMPVERFLEMDEAIATAESCLECGVCEERCPYELPIREMLKENTAWFRDKQIELA